MNNKIPPPIVTLICGLTIYFSRNLFPNTQGYLSSTIAISLFLFAILILVAAVLSFKKQGTTVNPLQPEKASSLVISGLFKYTRNPMYLAMVFILLSLTSEYNAIGGVVVTTLFVFYISKFQIIPEENALQRKFGEEFERYKEKTRRWI